MKPGHKKRTPAGANAPDVETLHTRLKQIVREQIEDLPGLLEQLPAADRVKILLELLPYCAPKFEKAPAPQAADGWGVVWPGSN